jgi:anti-sigma factor RsiW
MSSGRPISEDDLHAYVDDALAPAHRAEVENYLDRHPDIAVRVQGYQAQREALRAALAPVAEEPIPAQLNLARLIAAQRHPRAKYWQAAAAACICLALGGTAGWSLRGVEAPPQTGIAALAREAAVSFAVFGSDHGRPVEIKASDSAALVRWVSDRLQHPVSVPDLSASGYRFMGGRLVATPNGPAGLFMYDDASGQRVAVLLRPMQDERTERMSEHTNGSTSGFAWAARGIGYSLVGTAPPDRLHPLANEVRRQVDSGA